MGRRSANAKRRLVQSVLAIATVLSAAAASAVQVTLPANAVIASVGNTTVVPVTIADTAGVLGVAVSFTYTSGIATATNVSSAGTLTVGCTVIPSIGTPGMVVITAACPSGLPAGGGTLFNVTFQGVANGVTALDFTQTDDVPDGCLLNEGSPSCEPVDGQLTVGTVGPTATSTATATNTSVPATATASSTPTASATATNTVPTATATPSFTATFTNTIGPSPTPTNTGTATFTPTVTSTATVTNTPVNTNTTTPTLTQSQTPTITSTPTVTPTRTVTNTRAATNTRPAIPVVPSPTSPSGLLMIIALGAGLLWALVRVSKSH